MVKAVLTGAFLVLLALIWFHRDRIYLRDPIATVYRDDIQQSGIQVFLNGSNDILIEQDADPNRYRILVQHWNQAPGTPTLLRCIQWMACLTEAAHPDIIPLNDPPAAAQPRRRIPAPAPTPVVAMTTREVSFTWPDRTRMRVVLR